MLFNKFIRIFRKNHVDEKILSWINKQSHPEDALVYLIEKELYEHGERDLSYVVPRMRDDAYFESLNHSIKGSSYFPNFAHSSDTASPPPHKQKKASRTAEDTLAKKTIPQETNLYQQSLTNVNKPTSKKNNSSVVITAPSDHYYNTNVDTTCFED